MECVSEVYEADVVAINMCELHTSILRNLQNILEGIKERSLRVVLNAAIYIYKEPTLAKRVISRGFVRFWIPINGSTAVFIKRGFNESFLKNPLKYIEIHTFMVQIQFILILHICSIV